jgi:mycoredoxin
MRIPARRLLGRHDDQELPPMTNPLHEADADPLLAHAPIVVFWRPGCGFCASLDRGLSRLGVDYAKVNIWDEPEAAAFVRSVARGNEVVPTVRIGTVALVNPSPHEVLTTAREEVPEAVAGIG